MALFGSDRDASLVRTVNRELINNFIDVEIAFYKLSLEDTRANMYDESDSKVYFSPMRINCLALKDEKTYIGDDVYDQTRTGEFAFLRDDLKDKNIIIEKFNNLNTHIFKFNSKLISSLTLDLLSLVK